MSGPGPRPRHRARWVPLLAGCLLVLAGCGSDGASSPEGGSTATSDERSAATGPVPLTEVSLSDLEEASDEIATLLAFGEGGDDPCNWVPEGETLQAPVIVETADRVSPDIQIGWNYVVCWDNGGLDSFELVAPNGETVAENEHPWPAALPPGSPIGTYTAIGTRGTERFESEVEVVPAREPRLLHDPVVGEPQLLECRDVVEAYLVGFTDVDAVEVAVYDSPDPGGEATAEGAPPAELMGVISVPVDEDGSARLEVRPGASSPDRSISIVADPDLADELWSFGSRGPGEELLRLDYGQQLAIDACFGEG